MANPKKTAAEALSTIDAALTILNDFPELDSNINNPSFNTDLHTGAINPVQFIVDILKHTKGYDYVIEAIAKKIALVIPALEIAIKGVLLSKFKDILSCSVNPIIDKEMIQNGFVFDLNALDIMGILNYTPLQSVDGILNKGRHMYFGCECYEMPDDIKDAGDFNAFLWFVKNRAVRREVWMGVNNGIDITNSTIADSAYMKGLFNEVDCSSPEYTETGYYRQKPKVYNTEGETKNKKKDGIVTLLYKERGDGSLVTSEGYSSINSGKQIPHNNVLQVFIGNVTGWGDKTDKYEEYRQCLKRIKFIQDSIKEIDKLISKAENKYDEELEKYNIEGKTEEEIEKYRNAVEETGKVLELLNESRESLMSNLETATKERDDLANEFEGYETNFKTYDKNYYYGFPHTLMEFNTDFIMSMKILDSKVVIASMIDALTGTLSLDLNLSYEQIIIKEEVKKLVEQVIKTDDAVVSDCFFTFSNEQYEKMERKAELQRAGLFSLDGESNTTKRIDVEAIMAELDGLNSNSTLDEQVQVIKHGLNTISRSLSEEVVSKETHSGMTNIAKNFKDNVRAYFIDNILNSLVYSVTTSVLSPKLYLLMALNLKVVGKKAPSNVEVFIDEYKNLFVSIIREIRDKLLEYLMEEVSKITGALAKAIAFKFGIERNEYYRSLLDRFKECIRSMRGYGDFTVDNVGYADIYSEEGEQPPAKC